MPPLGQRARGFGCVDLVPLDEALSRPDQLDYLDLLPGQRNQASCCPVSAVALHQGVALLYLIDAPAGDPGGEEIARAQRLLANRSDPAWLGVLGPGTLDIYPVGFHPEGGTQSPVETVRIDQPQAPLFFQSLAQGTFDKAEAKDSDYVFQRIFGLITQTTERFVPDLVKPLDVLSMTGRALFFRFLIDRRIVRPSELGEICPAAADLKDAFSDPAKAAAASAWLDETFNGDFLPLVAEDPSPGDRHGREDTYRAFYEDVAKRTDGEFFLHLRAILQGWEVVGTRMQMELDWGDLDFAHVPVGVLSQVYQSFSHIAEPRKSDRTSVHYTPRIIAELMVDQVFSAVPDAGRARVLDPSCGAGIFLVLAFRRLVRERWEASGKRPGCAELQDILYNQLRGFEISESALRLAALSLYITAIELNATQRPPKALRFPRNLRDTVLFNFEDDGEGMQHFTLGSLQDNVAERFASEFDIVIGNPPWTRLREPEPQSTAEAVARKRKSKGNAESDRVNRAFTHIGRQVLQDRGLPELAEVFSNPDKNPDLPFLWRATQWTRPNGMLALVMPARLFMPSGTRKRSHVWEAVMRSVSVTGLVSGADLRWSSVWEGVKAPWCVLFARNCVPAREHRFQFAAPTFDASNRHARFRIDYEAAQPVAVSDLLERLWELKALSLGTSADVELMERILAAFPQTLEQYWESWDPGMDRTGKGYDLSPRLTQKPAEWLADLPDLVQPDGAFSVELATLNSFSANHGCRSAYRPKTGALYQVPLVVLPQSPGADEHAAKAYRFLREAPAFSQSYYGYSCAGHPCPETLADLIYLLAHSRLFRYFCLMTSKRSGFDRQTFNKGEFDALPFPAVETLPETEQVAIRALADRLEHDEPKPWDEMDAFLFRLYGLSEEDHQTARDTLFTAMSYRREGREAVEPPTHEWREQFAAELKRILEPFFAVCGASVCVREPEFQQDVWREPWHFLLVQRAGCDESGTVPPSLLAAAMAEADASGASRVVIRDPARPSLLVGVLSQKRWWTRTRARMLAQAILRKHLDVFGLDSGGEGNQGQTV